VYLHVYVRVCASCAAAQACLVVWEALPQVLGVEEGVLEVHSAQALLDR
jgi:hypothetical protein